MKFVEDAEQSFQAATKMKASEDMKLQKFYKFIKNEWEQSKNEK